MIDVVIDSTLTDTRVCILNANGDIDIKCAKYAMTTIGITWQWVVKIKNAAFLLREGMFVHAF